MATLPRSRPMLLAGAALCALALSAIFLPGIGPALLRTDGYAPHGYCILWQPGLLWFHVSNDILIGSSYVAIASTLAFLVFRARRDLPFTWVFLAFGIFIISCGSTHFIEVYTFWQPVYWLSGYLKTITAVASVATALALPPLIPRILGLLSAARLSNERKAQLEAANAELAQLNARLQELDELKSQLFANVSHELRTPLTLIIGPTERLLGQARGEQARELELILRNARVLQRHVDDLLDVARLEAGRLELQRSTVDLARLIRRTTDLFTAAAAERCITLSVAADGEQLIEADGEQLQRVVVNLISNALKFTPEAGEVRVTARLDGATATICVDDSGPGVPPALRARIFERFRQGEGGKTRRYGGTGLGLAIARELVVLHGGSIRVEDSPLGGARFTVVLPTGMPARLPTDAPRLESVSAAGSLAPTDDTPRLDATSVTGTPAPIAAPIESAPLVLVVEDHPEMRAFIAGTLSARFRVATASNGREGLEQARELCPDVIVTDLMMPELSGDQLLAALRDTPELAGIPVIMLTARADRDLQVEVLQQGAQDYLVKPFSAPELLARVGNLTSMARARATLQQALSSSQEDLATLSAEVTRLYDEARRALRLRDEFLTIAAHELRTPITALIANAQLLRRRAERGDLAPERDLRTIRALADLGQRLAALVETLLDVGKAERHELTAGLEPVDLVALARRQVELLHATLDRHQLHVIVPEAPLMVLGDPRRLQQVIDNLLSNAVKYSPEGGPLTIEVRRGDGMACLSVTDTGIGIPADALPHIFERFYRAPNADPRLISGFGVGLYLAHEIVAAHGGELRVASREGEGSTFTLCLPLAPSQARPSP
ncbi:MAG: ATP-binding protein [Chloroflexi bacterium OHK40]